MGEEVVACLADPLRMGLPDLGEGDVACLQDLGVLEIVPVSHLNHTFNRQVDICDPWFAILQALKDDATIVLGFLGPVTDRVPVLMIQGVKLGDGLRLALVARRICTIVQDRRDPGWSGCWLFLAGSVHAVGGELPLHLAAGDHVGIEAAEDVGGGSGVDLELTQRSAILDALDGRPDPPHDSQDVSAERDSHALYVSELEAHLPDEVVVDERVIPVDVVASLRVLELAIVWGSEDLEEITNKVRIGEISPLIKSETLR